MAQSKASKQASAGVSPRSGVAPPKERQFGQPNGNPRHNGSWKKEDTPRYKLEQMLKLSRAELVEIDNDENAPMFERRIARSLISEEKWSTTESIINQIQGYPKQAVEQTNIELKPILPKPNKTRTKKENE